MNRFQYGDFIEKYLVQSRDIDDVMKAARSGRVKDRRQAAFELATMASSSDDNKFRIVAEGGLELLIRMALAKDEATQEHSVEALAELMTVPAIQVSDAGALGGSARRSLYGARNAMCHVIIQYL